MVNSKIDFKRSKTVSLICLNDIKRDQNGTLCIRAKEKFKNVRIPIVTYALNATESTNG